MAEELDSVTQQFIADTAEYTAEIEEAAATAQEFAAANEEAKVALDGVRDHAAEAAAALGVYQDEAGRWRNSAGQFASSAELEAAALGHVRDEALEAELAVRKLRDSEAEAAAAGAAASGGGLSMMAVGMTALVGAAAALAPAVLAAGAGIGAFGLFAAPALKSVSSAYTQINADQQAYNRALTATAKNTALAHLKQDYASLSPAQRGAVEGIQQLVGEYHKLSATFAPEAFSLFAQALKIASDLLPKLVPLAQAGGQALAGLMSAAGKGLDSKGFTDFLAMLTRLVVPATQALTQLAGTVTGILGSAITQLAPMSVPFIQMLNGLLAAAGPGLVGALKLIGQTLLDIGHAITPLIGPLAAVLSFMGQHPIFAQMATVLLAIVAAVRLWAVAQGILDIALNANPIGLLIAAIALLVIGVVELVTHWKTVWHDITAAVDDAVSFIKAHWQLIVTILLGPVGIAITQLVTHWNTIKTDATKIIDDVINWIKQHWQLLVGILGGPVAAIVVLLATHWKTITADVSKMISTVLGFFEKLPGQILGFLEKVPAEMLSIGQNIVRGLINGIASMGSTLASSIINLIPSPIRSLVSSALGIFSPSTVFHGYGVNIVQGLINGVRSTAPQLAGAMRDLSGHVITTGSSLAGGAIAPAGGSTSVHVSVPLTVQGAGSPYADPAFQQYLQQQMQEATLRYAQLNPGNGLTPAWGR